MHRPGEDFVVLGRIDFEFRVAVGVVLLGSEHIFLGVVKPELCEFGAGVASLFIGLCVTGLGLAGQDFIRVLLHGAATQALLQLCRRSAFSRGV